MKRIATSIFLCLFFALSFAQDDVESLVREGIKYHENGDYDKAIDTYKKALKIDSESSLVNYELALTYFKKGDYTKVIVCSDKVLNQKGNYMLQAYLTKGSALDLLGKTDESIEMFEKAITESDPHYLLYYNLALNYSKLHDYENAESNVIKAIEINSSHPTSHLLLANIHNNQGHAVQTLLAAHYFLLLEPNTQRAKSAFEMLEDNFGGNVSKDAEKPNTINIMLSLNQNSEFSAAELMVSMLVASNSLEENKDKSEFTLFEENTTSFFKVLGELKATKSEGIWWNLYAPFFYQMGKSELMEIYCHYIRQSAHENSQSWIAQNQSRLMLFTNWLKAEVR